MSYFLVIQSLKKSMRVCGELWRAPLTEPEIERVAVCSCMISSIGFDPQQRALQVEFSNGHLYRVDEVPAKMYTALMQSENFDQYYRKNILRRFESQKIGVLIPLGC